VLLVLGHELSSEVGRSGTEDTRSDLTGFVLRTSIRCRSGSREGPDLPTTTGVDAPLPGLAQLLLAAPLAVLLHELAHAGMALALTRGKVLVVVGYGPGLSLRLGRLSLRLSPLAASGCCVHRATRDRSDRAVIAAAGPVASLMLAVLGWRVAEAVAGGHGFVAGMLAALGVVSAAITLLTAAPVRYPAALAVGDDRDSDGMTVLRSLRRRPPR
jgi:hypothetical protein